MINELYETLPTEEETAEQARQFWQADLADQAELIKALVERIQADPAMVPAMDDYDGTEDPETGLYYGRDWQNDDNLIISYYAGTVFSIYPSRKYYTPWANSNLDRCPYCSGYGSLAWPGQADLTRTFADLADRLADRLHAKANGLPYNQARKAIRRLAWYLEDQENRPTDLDRFLAGLAQIRTGLAWSALHRFRMIVQARFPYWRQSGQKSLIAPVYSLIYRITKAIGPPECHGCHGHGSHEAWQDMVFSDTLYGLADKADVCLTSGEGDPCDIFLTAYLDLPDLADQAEQAELETIT